MRYEAVELARAIIADNGASVVNRERAGSPFRPGLRIGEYGEFLAFLDESALACLALIAADDRAGI
jgi:hypothetical protein